MENLGEFCKYLERFQLNEEETRVHLAVVEEFLAYDAENAATCSETRRLESFCAQNIAEKPDDVLRVVALIRYFRFSGNEMCLIHLLTMCNVLDVFESIEERARDFIGAEACAQLREAVDMPAFGSPQAEYPRAILALLASLRKLLPEQTCARVLAGNNHQIPPSHFEADKDYFMRTKDIDEFLKYRHARTLAEMERCMDEGRLWYEQKITPQVLEFVRANQEIQSGVRVGDTIFVTKIPYMVHDYLQSTDCREKRYLSCHCPFVRASIESGGEAMDKLWCNCSGGFEKLIFDVIYGAECEVEVLSTVISGDEHCRFAIRVPV